MARSLSAAYQTFIAAATRARARCAKIKRKDGVIVGLTSLDIDLTFDLGDGDGPVTYRAQGGMAPTAHRASHDLSVDNQELRTLFRAEAIAEADLRAGRYDHAAVEIFEVNYRSLGDGRRWLDRGHLGRVSILDNGAVVEFRSLMHHYSREILRTYNVLCDQELGSALCGMPLDPPVWQPNTAYDTAASGDQIKPDYVVPSAWDGFIYPVTTAGVSSGSEPSFGPTTNDGTVVWGREEAWQKRGSVSAVASRAEFTVPGLTPRGASSFVLGRIKFLDGANAGVLREIKAVAGDVFTLYKPFPLDVSVNDNVAVFPGCRKTGADCNDIFANIENMQGFEHVPSNDVALATGASADPAADDDAVPARIVYKS